MIMILEIGRRSDELIGFSTEDGILDTIQAFYNHAVITELDHKSLPRNTRQLVPRVAAYEVQQGSSIRTVQCFQIGAE